MARRGWYALASKVGEVAALRSSLTVWKDITASGCRLLSSQASHAAEEAEDLAGSPEANLAAVDVSYPTYMVWGSNTGVGKTLVSAGLCSAIFRQSADARRRKDLLYLKPVQTGFPTDSDARYVYQEVSRVSRLHPEAISEGLFVSNHTLQVSPAVRMRLHVAENQS